MGRVVSVGQLWQLTGFQFEYFLNNKEKLQCADPGCLSRIRIFSIPDPRSEVFPSRIRIEEFNLIN
jgi:hypothetical protein